jgi:hypothetical protein
MAMNSAMSAEMIQARQYLTSFLSRLRAVDYFAIGRRLLAMVAVGRLTQHPVRQFLMGHAVSRDAPHDTLNSMKWMFTNAATDIESRVVELTSVFSEFLVPDIVQSKMVDQSALWAANILNALSTASDTSFGIWFSDSLDQIVSAGPAATEVGTQRPLAEFMVGLAQISDGDEVFDPCCGLGAILSRAAISHKNLKLRGIDVHGISWAFTTLRLYLLKQECLIHRGDGIREFNYVTFNRILCDPPLGSYLSLDGKAAPEFGRIAGLGQRRLDSVFLEKCWRSLTRVGRAVVLVSQATLSRRGDQELRRELLASGAVEGVIGLPSGAVPWTSVELALVILDMNHVRNDVKFIDGALARRHGAMRLNTDFHALMEGYEKGDGAWFKRIRLDVLLEEANLLPKRHLYQPGDRRGARELFAEAEEEFAKANFEADAINALVEKLGLDKPTH